MKEPLRNSFIDGVIDLSSKIMSVAPRYVTINREKIEEVAKNIKNAMKSYSDSELGYPGWMNTIISTTVGSVRADEQLFMYELLAGSINYQYWYGQYNIRHNNASSSLMYKLLDEACEQVARHDVLISEFAREVLPIFIGKLTVYRFPNLENRVRHLNETVAKYENNLYYLVAAIREKEISINTFIEIIVTSLPGYRESSKKTPMLASGMNC